VSKFTIKNNTFDNSNRPWNAGSDPNHFTHAKGAATFSDLPAGSKTVIAFILARRPSLAHLVNGNTIEDNKITAYCAPASQCTGLGYFASRGTGYGPNSSWSASTTNYLQGQQPLRLPGGVQTLRGQLVRRLVHLHQRQLTQAVQHRRLPAQPPGGELVAQLSLRALLIRSGSPEPIPAGLHLS
jgi:hypothetical protein